MNILFEKENIKIYNDYLFLLSIFVNSVEFNVDIFNKKKSKFKYNICCENINKF